MALTFKRTSLITQVADALRAEVLRGAWFRWLPTERELCQSLHVSRNTCRSALRALYREGMLEAVHARGIRIKRRRNCPTRPALRRDRSIGLVVPDNICRLEPRNSLLIEEIQAELYDMQVRLQLHINPACYRHNPGPALEKLVKRNRHDCWILMQSQRPLQRWFGQRKLRCLVTGSNYSDIKLPSIDYDYRAICRHAAGTLLSLGHRRLVLLNRSLRAAGDLESETGFFEGVRNSSYERVEARLAYHDDNLKSVSNVIKNLILCRRPPTGIVIANSFSYLSVLTVILRSGLRVPDDISLISRDDDPFLTHVDPEPARYLFDSSSLAHKTIHMMRSLLDQGVAKHESVRVVPRFITGGSMRKL